MSPVESGYHEQGNDWSKPVSLRKDVYVNEKDELKETASPPSDSFHPDHLIYRYLPGDSNVYGHHYDVLMFKFLTPLKLGLEAAHGSNIPSPDVNPEAVIVNTAASLVTAAAVQFALQSRSEVSGLRLQVLDAFRPRGATWSAQVISSPPGPSGDPFMTHLLPGGAVSRVNRAQTSVLSRLPPFATSRSVCYLATRLQALTYYAAPLVLGGLGRRRRRARATGLMLVGATWAGAVAPLVPWQVQCPVGVCAALAAPQGVRAGAGARIRLLPPASPAVRVAGCPFRVYLVLACWYVIPGGLCVLRAWYSCPSGARRVPVLWPCARASAVSASPPAPFPHARTRREVPWQGAGTPVPGGPCPSAFPDRIPCPPCFVLGGFARSTCLPAWLPVACLDGGVSVWPAQPVVRGGLVQGGGGEGGHGSCCWGWAGQFSPGGGLLSQAAVRRLRGGGSILLPPRQCLGRQGWGLGSGDTQAPGVALRRVAGGAGGSTVPLPSLPGQQSKFCVTSCFIVALEGVVSILLRFVAVYFRAPPRPRPRGLSCGMSTAFAPPNGSLSGLYSSVEVFARPWGSGGPRGPCW